MTILIYDQDITLSDSIKEKYERVIYADGRHYTRIMLPSFVFIICADIFFTIISVFRGGIFKGWFSKKKPKLQDQQ